MLRIIVIMLLFTLPVMLLAADTAPSAEQIKGVTGILAGLDPEQEASLLTVENNLVALGEASAPAINSVLQQQRDALLKAEKAEESVTVAQLQAQCLVLDDADIRLTRKIDPHAIIITYLKALKMPDGSAFTRSYSPRRIIDARLARTFPHNLFYYVYFAPYRGGAAPPEILLQQFAVPTPLSNANTLVIDGGKVQLITDTDTMLVFFKAATTAVKTQDEVKDITASWLRLSAELQSDTFTFTIPAEKLEATPINMGWLGSGVADVVPAKFLSGSITVWITFGPDNKLSKVQMQENLQNNMPQLP